MAADGGDDLVGCGGWGGVYVWDGAAARIGAWWWWRWVEVCRLLGCRADVFDFVHEHVYAFVQAGSDALVEHLLEAFLLFDRLVQEVVAVCELCGDHFLRVEDVDHLLDQIADVDELEECHEGLDAGCFCAAWVLALGSVFADLTWVVIAQVFDGFVETGAYVPVAEYVEEFDEYGLALLFGC